MTARRRRVAAQLAAALSEFKRGWRRGLQAARAPLPPAPSPSTAREVAQDEGLRCACCAQPAALELVLDGGAHVAWCGGGCSGVQA